MKSRFPIAALAVLPAALLPVATGPRAQDEAGEARSLLRAVPADAALFISVTDLAGMRAEAGQNAWGRMLGDPEMTSLWDFFRDQFRSEMDAEDREDFDRELPLFLKAMQGSAVAFITGPDLEDFGFLVEPGPGRADFEEFLAQVGDRDEDDATYEDYEGVSLELSEASEPNDGGLFPTEVSFDLDGVWCFVRGSERETALELAQGAIDRLRGSDEASVESSALLAAARAGRFAGRIEFFADAHRLVTAIPDLTDLDEDEQHMIDLLGISGITWLHATLDLGPGEALDMHLRLPTPGSGYLADWLGALGPLPKHLAALGPHDTINAALYNVDLFALYESAWDLFADLDPEGYEQARAAFDGGLQQFGGLDLEGDLLAQLTGELAVFALPIAEAEFEAAQGLLGSLGPQLPPELRAGRVYVTGLEDAEGVELFLEEALNAIGPLTGLNAAAIESEDFQGFSVQSLDLPMGLSFSWCFAGDSLITSLFPSALRSVLALHGKEDAPSILASELFGPYVEQHAGASVLGLAPSEVSVRTALGAIGMLADLGESAAWDNLDGGEPTSWPFADAPIPDGSLAGRYLEGTVIFKLEHAERVLELSLMAR